MADVCTEGREFTSGYRNFCANYILRCERCNVDDAVVRVRTIKRGTRATYEFYAT